MQNVRYCGSQTPPDFFSVGRSIELVFASDSDSSGAGRGFKLEYKAAGCNRTYENGQGRIFSPESPGNSPIFLRCAFSIRGSNGSFISLYFNKFQLPGATATSLECTESVFEVRIRNLRINCANFNLLFVPRSAMVRQMAAFCPKFAARPVQIRYFL